MPFLIKHVTEIVLVLFALILLGDLCLIGMVLIRRQRRQKFFKRVDGLREQYGPVIAGVLSGRMAYPAGLEKLGRIAGRDRLLMLEQLCLEHKPSPAEEPTLRRLCEDLGLVRVWQQRLAGMRDSTSLLKALMVPHGLISRIGFLRFLSRSKSAENLGRIRHQPSWPLLVKALDDSHPDLQTAAAQALAAIGHPGSFPALVERLHKAVLRPSPVLSVRTLKSALISFPLSNACRLKASLRQANPRIRFLAVDVIREMAEREAAGNPDFLLDASNLDRQLVEMLLTELPIDPNPDVRARVAPLIARIDDARAAPILSTLVEDAAWFVRLHAVRSLAGRRFHSHAEWLAGALTDPDWRVREAAVRTLKAHGPAGMDQLMAHFLGTQDRYSREQIADEFQRAGLIPQLVARCAETGNGRETTVLRHLVEMGKTSCMVSALDGGPGNGELRKKFLQKFGQSPDPRIREWIEQLALQTSAHDAEAPAELALVAEPRHGEA